MSSTLNELVYGSAQLYGYRSQERVSVDSGGTFTLSAFEYFEIISQTGISMSFDGILGMSRPMYSSSYTSGPLLIEAFYNNSITTSKIFSVKITDGTSSQFLDIGTMDESVMSGGSATAAGLSWVYAPNKNIIFWYGIMTSTRFGEDEIDSQGTY